MSWTELMVTDLLSAKGRPAVLGRAQNRRTVLFLRYRRATDFVRASLIEQVEAGDILIWCGDRGAGPVQVLDPALDRGIFGERTSMRVQAHDGTYDLPVVGLDVCPRLLLPLGVGSSGQTAPTSRS